MSKSKVALVRCEDYDFGHVKEAVQKGIDLLGGPAGFVSAGETILLKPNWLSADPPEKCVTTHPSVFKAVAGIFQKAGAELTYGDSPAFQNPEHAAKRSGIEAVAAELGIAPADFQSGREVFFSEGRQNKKFTIANGVLDSDGVISLPKMKTHAFQRVTGAVKNQFGCIPGPRKGEFHVRIPDAAAFARMLIDLNSYIRPRLFIMDGILAMEGNGPRGGTPRKMNVLLLSADPVALDTTVCRLMNLNPELVLTNKAGIEMGLGTCRQEEIELLGDPVDSFVANDFRVNRKPMKAGRSGGGMAVIKNALVPRPYIIADKCVKCGVCVKMCPVTPKAVDWHDGNKSNPPSYRYDRCIRCYCCQELCPQSAIRIKVPLIRRVFGKDGSHEKLSS
ncbi:DUF362 domain-containing protein [Caproicibacter sp.]|uniref:DUF362 domain-containing protein n=1 Tax=Caproicibacter sp. TaxID=2814884 RepID=UPI003989A97E